MKAELDSGKRFIPIWTAVNYIKIKHHSQRSYIIETFSLDAGHRLHKRQMSNYKQKGKGAESRAPHHPPHGEKKAYKSRTSLNRTWRPDRVVVFEVGAEKATGVVAVGGSAGMQTDCGTGAPGGRMMSGNVAKIDAYGESGSCTTLTLCWSTAVSTAFADKPVLPSLSMPRVQSGKR
ncbi:hypothetical protein ACJJTC_014073 [Scirpophaga incertulas]